MQYAANATGADGTIGQIPSWTFPGSLWAPINRIGPIMRASYAGSPGTLSAQPTVGSAGGSSPSGAIAAGAAMASQPAHAQSAWWYVVFMVAALILFAHAAHVTVHA